MTNDSLTVGVYQPKNLPQSFRVYSSNILNRLSDLGVVSVAFDSVHNIPKNADVLWDIRSGGGNAPPDFLLDSSLPPLVVTVHGFAPTSLPANEYFTDWRDRLLARFYAQKKRKKWYAAKEYVSRVIAVSHFTKQEVMEFTGIGSERINVCAHGVEINSFVKGEWVHEKPYFFHISNNEPRKNIHRIITAFNKAREKHRIELILKLPEDSIEQYAGIEGVTVIGGFLSDEQLVKYYQGAVGFVFPSLYEGFGLPILEAMACGCPVITSNVTACAEVADSAAYQVDPRSVHEIKNAMCELIVQDTHQRQQIIEKGLQRVKSFDWMKSANCHMNTFLEASSVD